MKKTFLFAVALATTVVAGCGPDTSGPAVVTELTPERLAEIEAADKAVEEAEMAQKAKQGE